MALGDHFNPRDRDPELNSDEDDDEEEDEDEDEVIKTIPVYYTPTYISSLTLLQYPDRLPRPDTHHPLLPPALRPPRGLSDEAELARSKINAKYKPKSQHLQFEVPVDTAPETWNDGQAAKFAKGLVDEKREKEELMRGKKGRRKNRTEEEEEEERRREQEKAKRRLSKIIYTSQSMPDVTNYLVGVVKDDKLHLSPVTQTYQMRPSLLYLDQIATNERRAKREAQNAENDDDSDGDVSDSELKKEAAKAVQVSVKINTEGAGGSKSGGGTGAGNGRAGAALFDPLRAMEGESWIELEHYHSDTIQATLAFDKMFAQDENLGVQLTSTTKPSEYLKS